MAVSILAVKLTHPAAIRLCALVGSGVLRAWMGTLDLRFFATSDMEHPRRSARPLLYLFWHENLLLPAYTHASMKIPVLVSHHRDGELIAQVVRLLRGRTVRGSTTHGGAAAMRELVRHGRLRHLAMTPDGPKGPRRMLQDGCVYLASRTGMGIVPVGCAYRSCWRMRSWDRFAVPRPGTLAILQVGAVVDVPAQIERSQVETCRQKVQAAMDATQARAEQLADMETLPKAIPLDHAMRR